VNARTPGAQLRFTDIDGHRFTCFATNTRRGQLADLELRHRRRAEDRIRCAKDTGLRLQLFTASMAFAVGDTSPRFRKARHSLVPPAGRLSNNAAGFASCYGPRRRSPLKVLLTLGFDPARFQTKPPACYRASRQLPGPDFPPGGDELTNNKIHRLRHGFTSCSAGRTKAFMR
jgi:hypothetical protein